MGTGRKVKKSRTPRKFSQSSMRSLTKIKSSDIFDTPEPTHDEKAELAAKRSREAIEEEEARRKALNHVFISGKRYIIRRSPKSSYGETTGGSGFEAECIFEYIKKEGKHHMFREVHGGWSRTYTDPQLIGKIIQEVE